MKTRKSKIFLPGGEKQLYHLLGKIDFNCKKILVIGSNSEAIARRFIENKAQDVIIIVDDYNSLLNSKYDLKSGKEISVRFMEFENTDFENAAFDLVYAQASISNPIRNKIIKEIKRILKDDGYVSIGELTSLKTPVPRFLIDVWNNGNILPIKNDKLIEYYANNGFIVTDEIDLSFHLKDFYLACKNLLEQNFEHLSENEKAYYKKTISRMSHESNAYLNLGGKEYMGFTSIIARKAN